MRSWHYHHHLRAYYHGGHTPRLAPQKPGAPSGPHRQCGRVPQHPEGRLRAELQPGGRWGLRPPRAREPRTGLPLPPGGQGRARGDAAGPLRSKRPAPRRGRLRLRPAAEPAWSPKADLLAPEQPPPVRRARRPGALLSAPGHPRQLHVAAVGGLAVGPLAPACALPRPRPRLPGVRDHTAQRGAPGHVQGDGQAAPPRRTSSSHV
mmetsp:Transcript_76416/g.236648  ORF Transcript_76416/g.236648 Transcript_76416/m.236648 type:complete len:206 (+) Transcript_76416:193-810(+)